MFGAGSRRLKPITGMVTMLLLSACVVPHGDGRIEGAGPLPHGTTVALTPSQSPLASFVAQGLVDHGFRVGESGDFSVETGYSERPLDVALVLSDPVRLSPPKYRIIALCPQRVHRLVVLITETRTGRIRYQGQSELTKCVGKADENVAALVESAMADLSPLQAVAAP
jgi:hypothetical protein